MNNIMIDTHTHTVLSGHAWSTLRENACGARQRGLAGMCLTEHGHAMPGAGPFFLTSAQKMLPPEIEGIRLFYGVEANILDLDGNLDISDRMLFGSEWNIASMHDVVMEPGNADENTKTYLAVLDHPAVDMLGHLDDGAAPNHHEVLIARIGELGKIVEINNNSLNTREGSYDRVKRIASECARLGVRVAVSSDAHFDSMVGNVKPALAVLEEVDFPEELVINRSMEAFQAYLDERNARLAPLRAKLFQ